MKTSFGIVPLILTLTVLTTMPGVSPAASKNDGRRDGGSLAYGEYGRPATLDPITDRKSTRLNSSHSQISYAVFCLKKKQMHTQNCLLCQMTQRTSRYNTMEICTLW